MLILRRTNSENIDFIHLVTLLDADLAVRDGADHAFYAQFNKTNMIKHTVVAYLDGIAVACGAFKPYNEKAVEIKRMYVSEGHRRQGIAFQVLRELEKWAASLQNNSCVLETGRNQPEAISLYEKAGYHRIPNYGQYAMIENSVCLQKELECFQLQPTHLYNTLIKLVPLQESDAERLYAVAADPLIWEGHPKKDRYKKEAFMDYFNSAVKDKNGLLVFERASNELIGSTRFYAHQPGLSSVAIGFTFLARKFWGGKYNAALKTLMMDYAFKFVDVIVFHIGITNIRSQKAVEKIGAIKTREIEMDFNGTKQPYLEYEINKINYTPIFL
jgi:RimJ/RimL family protein N-acetyltransferase